MNNLDALNIGQSQIPDEQISRAEQRYAILEPLLEKTLPPGELRRLKTEAITRLGVSERTLRSYLNHVKSGGILSLIRKPRADKGCERSVPDSFIQKIILLLRENPHRTIPSAMRLLAADPQFQDTACSVSSSSVYRKIKSSDFDLTALRTKAEAKIYHSFEAEHINQLWQGDARHGILIPDSSGKARMTYLFAWVDDFSRKILFAKYYRDEKLPRLEDALRQAILRWGLPEKIYLDNGSAYVSKQFALVVSALGIRKIHHPPYQAWCKGKVEAVMKIIKGFQREAAMAGFKTIEELNSALEAWLAFEYDKKIHSTTGQPPHERFLQSAEKFPPKRIKDLEQFRRMFFWEEKRTVTKFATISMRGNTYKIRNIYPGERVCVRFDPFDLSQLWIYYRGTFHSMVKAHQITNTSCPNMPQERDLPKNVVSAQAQQYFTKLRERHLAEQKNALNNIAFTKLNQELIHD